MPHGNDRHGEVSDTQVVENQIVMFLSANGPPFDLPSNAAGVCRGRATGGAVSESEMTDDALGE
jgi:hypothetical protein